MNGKLKEYRQKRDFARTPEPSGDDPTASGKRLRFVVQKHDATNLHYDLRLELEGVLKSWAVPKEPQMEPGMRRLAVQTEDHPLEYATFEGEIPKPGYGAGTVVIWDQGTWIPAGEHPARAIAMGKIDFELRGERLSGRWTLVRVGQRSLKTARKDNWLLIKRTDFEAPPPRLRTRPSRVDPASLPGAIEATVFDDVGFQLAMATDNVPTGDDWIHEPKLDGYRLLCHVDDGKATLITRNGHDWTDRFPHVAEAAADLPCSFAVLDGEAVVFDAAGVSHFQKLQHAIAERENSIAYVAFDILFVDGWDVRAAPLVERKRLLESLISRTSDGVFRYGDHLLGNGPTFFAEVCRLGLEGSISKMANDPYEAGRHDSWRKAKCLKRQEFVIVGFTQPGGKRKGFGALLVGTRDEPDSPLQYAGKVGTGFDMATLRSLRAAMDELESDLPTIDGETPGVRSRDITWVAPNLVAEVVFAGWTDSGLLRHPTYQGLREDKPAETVVLEKAMDIAPKKPAKLRARLTNPDRLLFPADGISKRDLAEYWKAVARTALPLIEYRPLSLLRCPDGADAQCFYQKHAGAGVPDVVPRVDVDDDGEPYTMVDGVQSLIGLTQIAAIELHIWGSTIEHLDKPDIIVFDLDPAEGLKWTSVVEAAFDVKERLEALGLVPFAKLTGGKGVHVVVPVEPGPKWPSLKRFAKMLAEEMAADEPDRYTSTMSKAKRTGKIFVDYLRNDRESTSIAPYSPRARAGAPVALPVEWDELEPGDEPPRYGILDAPERIKQRKRDPWKQFEASRKSLLR